MVDDLVIAGGGPAMNARLAAAQEAAAIVHSSTHDAWVVLAHGKVLAGFRDSRLSSDRVTAFEHLARPRRPSRRWWTSSPAGWSSATRQPTRLRQPVQAAFTTRRMARLAPAVTAIIDDLLDPVAEGGGADLREALAVPLPAIVIAQLLGVPRSDRALFRRWSNELAGIVFAASFRAADDVAALAGASSFATYFGDLVQYISLAPERAGQRAADATCRRILGGTRRPFWGSVFTGPRVSRQSHRIGEHDLAGGSDAFGGGGEFVQQASHAVVTDPGVRLGRDLVSTAFDPLAELSSWIRWPPIRSQKIASEQPINSVLPVVGRPASTLLIHLRRDAFTRREQDMGLAAVETLGGQERDVRVAAVLAQRRRGLPHRRNWVRRRGNTTIRREQGPA